MYALIKGTGNFIGIFSSKNNMQIVIEALIKDNFEKNGGPCGNFNFRWVKFNVDEPWITKDGKEASKEASAILSLYTMHGEKFTHKVMTDWSTGKVISMDAENTTNI